ncbi:MAG: peptidoglycan editing factor PgeF [Thermodesulfovibrionales bacterium]|nr:peptidoglycan editing factor PgeF [Thermodesulfovibrionales bacterium]
MDSIIVPENMNSAVKAFFTTKSLGTERVKICSAASLGNVSFYMPVQKHTDTVKVLDADLSPEIADAVITDKKGVLIGVQVADCVPVLLVDREKLVVGAVHAGWRGTAARILKKTIARMTEHFGSSSDTILIALGPSIRDCCYNVDTEVKEAVVRATGDGDYYRVRGEKYVVDLSHANRLQALSAGIPDSNIWSSSECTCCNPGKFYSYRFHKDYAGRQGGFIGIL